jgi:hypothetical protein
MISISRSGDDGARGRDLGSDSTLRGTRGNLQHRRHAVRQVPNIDEQDSAREGRDGPVVACHGPNRRTSSSVSEVLSELRLHRTGAQSNLKKYLDIF